MRITDIYYTSSLMNWINIFNLRLSLWSHSLLAYAVMICHQLLYKHPLYPKASFVWNISLDKFALTGKSSEWKAQTIYNIIQFLPFLKGKVTLLLQCCCLRTSLSQCLGFRQKNPHNICHLSWWWFSSCCLTEQSLSLQGKPFFCSCCTSPSPANNMNDLIAAFLGFLLKLPLPLMTSKECSAC